MMNRYRRCKSMGFGAREPHEPSPPTGEKGNGDNPFGMPAPVRENQPRRRSQRRTQSMGLGARDTSNGANGAFPPRKNGKKKDDGDFLDVTYRKDWMTWSENMDRKIQRRFASGSAEGLPRLGDTVRNSTITENDAEYDDPYVTPGYTGTEEADEYDDPYVTPGYTGTEEADEYDDPYVTSGYTGTEEADEYDDPCATPGYTGTAETDDNDYNHPYVSPGYTEIEVVNKQNCDDPYVTPDYTEIEVVESDKDVKNRL